LAGPWHLKNDFLARSDTSVTRFAAATLASSISAYVRACQDPSCASAAAFVFV
jgi:hypothetical protein